jgi:hypothetical protein
MAKTVDYAKEGIDHVNIYSQSTVELGRLMSNFTRMPFFHYEHGEFASMEGFYFFVSTGFAHQELRTCSGFEAKRIGSTFPRIPVDNFMEIIESGIRAKVRCNDSFREALEKSTLPFEHYYVFGKDSAKPKVHVPMEHQWIVELYETIRRELKEGVFQ